MDIMTKYFLYHSKVEPAVSAGRSITFQETAREVGDLGAGPFDRFESSPEIKKKLREEKLKERRKQKSLEEAAMKEKKSPIQEKTEKQKKSRKSSEGGFHSG